MVDYKYMNLKKIYFFFTILCNFQALRIIEKGPKEFFLNLIV